MTSFAFKSASLFFAASSLLAACGGDDGTDNPDACLGGGHGGAEATCGPWAEDVPEGGDVRIELQTDPSTNTTTLASHAYFFKNQNPLRRITEGPEVVAGTRCLDMTAGVYFDNGAPAEAVAIVDSRTYTEVGNTVTLSTDGQTITLDKMANAMDLSGFLTHDTVYMPASSDGSGTLRNKIWHAEWPGGEIPVTDLTQSEPVAVQGVRVDSQLFVPADITNVMPAFTSPLAPPATGDWDFTFDQEASPAGAAPLTTFLGFYNPATGGYEYMCYADASLKKITVPRAMIDKLAPSGYAYFGTFSHVGHIVQERRLDLVGVNCQFTTYDK